MTKLSSDTTKALDFISSHAYNIAKELEEYLEEGSIDEGLVVDISLAFQSWRSRTNQIKDPYCVWFWDGSSWSKITKDMYQEDAYKEWYRLTKGGRENSKPSYDKYYFLGLSSLTLTQRHPVDSVEADDFSIKYLLTKSFGE